MDERRHGINTQNLNIREMLVGHPNRLRYVIRFSTCFRLHDESVAEHSFYTAFYAMMVTEWVRSNRPDIQLDATRVLQSALIHDMEEARSGDFPRPFKYSTYELKRHLDSAALSAFRQVIRDLLPGENKSEISSSAEAWTIMWKHAKDDDTIEGRIVEYADFLSSAAYLCSELSGANRTMGEHSETLIAYFQTFDSPLFDFIRPLILQFKEIFADFFPVYHEHLFNTEDRVNVVVTTKI